MDPVRTQRQGCRSCRQKTPQNRNLKKPTDFVDTISEVLRDLPFSRNQTLKSADDKCIRILEN